MAVCWAPSGFAWVREDFWKGGGLTAEAELLQSTSWGRLSRCIFASPLDHRRLSAFRVSVSLHRHVWICIVSLCLWLAM